MLRTSSQMSATMTSNGRTGTSRASVAAGDVVGAENVGAGRLRTCSATHSSAAWRPSLTPSGTPVASTWTEVPLGELSVRTVAPDLELEETPPTELLLDGPVGIDSHFDFALDKTCAASRSATSARAPCTSSSSMVRRRASSVSKAASRRRASSISPPSPGSSGTAAQLSLIFMSLLGSARPD